MRTRHSAAVLFALVATMTLGGCGNDSATEPAPQPAVDLTGTTFIGDDVTVDDAPYDVVAGSTLRLTFDVGRITASAGCNTMSGAATWDDGTLSVDGGSLAMTEMGCDEPLMDQDTWFADFLTDDPTLTQNGASLTLTAGGTVIVLTAEDAAVPDASLTGTTWKLDGITNGDAVSSIPDGVQASLRLTKGGDVQAQLGCNSGSGTYSVSGDTITFGPMASTLMACDSPASDVEADMIATLQGDVTYTINGEQLLLTPTQTSGSAPTALSFTAG